MRNFIDIVEGKLNSIQQALFDRVPETGSIRINLDGSVMSTLRSLASMGLIDFKLNTATFQATVERKGAPAPVKPKADISSPAFKKWFGKSVIVDQHGDPLVLYHGTDRDFDAFDPNADPKAFEIDRGKFHFTDDLAQAEYYASDLAGGDLRQSSTPGKARVIHAYVSMQNPYIVDNCDEPAEEWAQSASIYAHEAEQGGHDGIVMQTSDGAHRVVIALSPSQIKYVNNNGTFDPDDPRMSH